MKPKQILIGYLFVVVLFSSSVAFAVDVTTGNKDIKLNVNVLLQARAQVSWDGDKPTGPNALSPWGSPETDFFIRRARLISSGTAYKNFTFYIMLDTPNFGIHGNYGGTTGVTILQDLHIGYQPNPDLDIEMGFLYMPLSHLAMNSSSGTSAIEKSTAILFYNRDRGLREAGVQVRGLLFDHRLYYRGGLYEGLHAFQADPTGPNAGQRVNPNGRPLVAGMLRLNLIGDETAYAFPTIYLDGKSRASIGIGGQYQTKGSNTPATTVLPSGARGPTINWAVNDYIAYSADIFADIALPDDQEIAFQGDVYRFDWGQGSDKTGFATTIELAYRWGKISPEVNGYWFNSDSRQNSFLKVAGGFNYFLVKHLAKLSLEFWHIKSGVNLDAATALHQVVFQGQINL